MNKALQLKRWLRLANCSTCGQAIKRITCSFCGVLVRAARKTHHLSRCARCDFNCRCDKEFYEHVKEKHEQGVTTEKVVTTD